MEKPRFKSHIRVKAVPPDLLILVGETGYRVLQSRPMFLVGPLIDGNNTVSDIAKRLKGKAGRFEIETALFLLDLEGLLVDGARFEPAALDLFRDSLNIDPVKFSRRLKAKRVHVVSLCDVESSLFQSVLERVGVMISAKAAFTIVLTDDYLRRELRSINRRMLRKGAPWMLVKPTGSVVWIGPCFVPRRTACWACLAHRLEQNREVERFARTRDSGENPFPAVQPFADVALHLAAVEALKLVATGDNLRGLPAIHTFDFRKMKLDIHKVQKLDDCEVCGPSKHAPRSARPLVLKSCKKAFTLEGGHRTTSAEATFRRYEHLISPISGIVDEVEPYYTDGRGLLYSYAAGHLFTPLAGPDHLVERGLRQVSTGKGMTPQQAKTSALCEALERYSGVFRGTEPLVRSSFRALGDRGIHPNTCMNYSERQYRARGSNPDRIPEPFDERREIDWAPVWSLSRKSMRYLPAAYCYYGVVNTNGREFCRADSNGNAAGNTIEEAILQGFLELVERDATALWWFNRAPRPGVNLDSFDLPYAGALCDAYRALGLDVWALDITSDFRIPAFVALASSRSSSPAQFLMGLGAHLDPAVALSRALTEMNQFLKGFLSGGSKRILRPTATNLAFLRAAPPLPATKRSDFTRMSEDDLREDIRRCIGFAESLGLETLVLDQTRADVGMPVVKVIVPGLRSLWPRFAPGRLYDVPVRLGWLRKPLKENQLNCDRIVL